ncbi:hypothetical protein DSM104299_04990 [Baekduia alba]|nr:DUF6510 family protein [Baekduia alba]WCB96233.1 hypothetical protein DSM104299_04990 [Baekduia alba]
MNDQVDALVLDGNAIGGLLADVFGGAELTAAPRGCGSCGSAMRSASTASTAAPASSCAARAAARSR